MSRLLVVILFSSCILLLPNQASAQIDSEEGRDVFQFVFMMDDAWGFHQMWETYAWSELKEALSNGILSSKNADDEEAADAGVESIKPPAFAYRFGSVEEDAATAASEEIVNTLIGAAFPAAGLIADIVSDYRMSFGFFDAEADDD